MTTLFHTFSLEASSRCNRKCGYCPVSKGLARPDLPEFVSEKVLARVLDELARLDYKGVWNHGFYGEPLLDWNLEGLVRRIRARLPDVRQTVFTNGDLLTDYRYNSLINAGVTLIVATLHSGWSMPERPLQVTRKPSEIVLSNRAGALGPPLEKPLELPCWLPSGVMQVDAFGDVILCCDDYYRQVVLGNVLKQGLDTIWFSEPFEAIRVRLQGGDRTATAICRQCSNHWGADSRPLFEDGRPVSK